MLALKKFTIRAIAQTVQRQKSENPTNVDASNAGVFTRKLVKNIRDLEQFECGVKLSILVKKEAIRATCI
jgi:hypothetical protein